MPEAGFLNVLLAAGSGLCLSLAIESLLRPRPARRRPWAAWALHAGLYLLAHAGLTLALGRPWFALAGVAALQLTLVLVNNAKVKALREPFVFQDYEYFTDAIRHPRLYIPFFGWWKFLAASAGFVLAVSVGLWGETVPAQRFTWAGQAGGVLAVFLPGLLLLVAGNGRALPVSFDAQRDLRALGMLACFWRYAQAEKSPLAAASPFAALSGPFRDGVRPHLVAVQSESFFDARALFAGIRPEVLAGFDQLRAEAVSCGSLQVPAWGANTVRSEFAFLSGLDEASLGVHRFNPYRRIAAGQAVASLASHLKGLGYRTVCVHPYPASFYQRDKVYPRLGFDEFLDIRAFAGAARFGPYISDAAVTDKIGELLQNASEPLFVFVITMENHGPLHLETVQAADAEALYRAPPPAGCDDLTIYLRHLRNADAMIARLRQMLLACRHPASLCWYGDHVPIMPGVYEALGTPEGTVEFVLWDNGQTRQTLGEGGHQERKRRLGVHELGLKWLYPWQH